MNKQLLKKYVLQMGLIAGILTFVLFIISYILTPDPLTARRSDIGINVILVWAAMFYYKRRQGGYLHFYEGMSVGFLTNLVAAALSGVLLFLFIKFVDYTPFQTWIDAGKKLLIEEKMTFTKILNDQMFKEQLASFDQLKPIQIVLDEIMFKQLAIVPISLMSLAMRKLPNV